MSILVWTLLRLLVLDSLMQKVNSFFIFFFQLSLDTFILNVLESIHLICKLVWIWTNLWHTELGQWIESLSRLHTWIVVSSSWCKSISFPFCCFLGSLSLFSELYVVLIKDYFLDVISWYLLHEKALRVAFFIPLDNFIFETQILKNLLKHGGSYRSSSSLFRLLGSTLLGVNLNRLDTISKLFKLTEDLLSFSLEFSLKHFESLLIIQFLTLHDAWLVSIEVVNASK